MQQTKRLPFKTQLVILTIHELIASKQPSVSTFHDKSKVEKETKTPQLQINLPKNTPSNLWQQPLGMVNILGLLQQRCIQQSTFERNWQNELSERNDKRQQIALYCRTLNNNNKQLLTERLGRKEVLINTHMESLLEISKPSANRYSRRKFYGQCESNIRALETLRVDTSSYGSLLILLLLKRLQEELHCAIIRETPDAFSSLNYLRFALKKEIETRDTKREAR